MRKRGKSIARWSFLIVGLALFLGAAATILLLGASNRLLTPEWQLLAGVVVERARDFLPSDEQIKWAAWIGGILLSLGGAALTLLASWHFSEINLPQRIEDLKKTNLREHLLLQPRILTVARQGLGPVIDSIESSRLTLLRKWLSGWSEKERARVLAASAIQLAKEASALRVAASEAEQRQITAHLIRGYQFGSQGDDEKAFEEFEAATRISADDRVSRDIAAGWARRLNNQRRELELLDELKRAAIATRSDVDHARALRREAELFEKRQNEVDWCEARDRLDIADKILQPLFAEVEAREELGRVLTLYCEVQCNRRKIGRLNLATGALTRARPCLTTVTMHVRPEEPGGEGYGQQRLDAVEQRIAELRGEAPTDGNGDGASNAPSPADDTAGGQRGG